MITKASHPKIAFLRFSALQRPILAAKFSLTLLTSESVGFQGSRFRGGHWRLALPSSPARGVASPLLEKPTPAPPSTLVRAPMTRPPAHAMLPRARSNGERAVLG